MRSIRAFLLALVMGTGTIGSGQAEPPVPKKTEAAPEKTLTNSLGMKLVLIPAGEFLMGAPPAAKDYPHSMPQHKVKISKPFYMGAYEVTNAQFEKISGKLNRAIGQPTNDPDCPVQGVAWSDAVRFCNRLSNLPEEKKAGRVYRLPTEAEWEYACRAGTTTRFHYGDSLSIDQANFDHQRPFPSDARKGPFLNKPMKVGSFKPNAFGLYDMHGNIREWCSDWWTDKFDFAGLTVDPPGPPEPQGKDPLDRLNWGKVRRGGTYRFDAIYCHSACRSSDGLQWRDMPDDGLRVVVSIPEPKKGPVEPATKPEPPKLEQPTTNSIGMKLQPLPAGKFMMGSPDSEKLRDERQEDLHEVELTTPFHIGVHEVTQEEYEKLMGKNPSYFGPKGEGLNVRKDLKDLKPEDLKRHPVETVTWGEAVEFCKKLSELPEEKKAGRVYRLPTEAEWEYACRAGTTTPFSFGNTISLSTQANYMGFDLNRGAYDGDATNEHRKRRTMPVGSYPPNPFGLYDMHGNVGEWCLDESYSSFYLTCPKQDPVFTTPGLISMKVERGGGWENYAAFCRSACRSVRFIPVESSKRRDLGFRVVMTVAPKTP